MCVFYPAERNCPLPASRSSVAMRSKRVWPAPGGVLEKGDHSRPRLTNRRSAPGASGQLIVEGQFARRLHRGRSGRAGRRLRRRLRPRHGSRLRPGAAGHTEGQGGQQCGESLSFHPHPFPVLVFFLPPLYPVSRLSATGALRTGCPRRNKHPPAKPVVFHMRA